MYPIGLTVIVMCFTFNSSVNYSGFIGIVNVHRVKLTHNISYKLLFT